MAITRIENNTNTAEEEQRLNDILSSINNHNQSFTDEQNRRLRETELKQEAAEREERNARMMEQFRIRHEKEAAEKAAREEAERLAEIEAEKKRQKNPFNNLIHRIQKEKQVIKEENETKVNDDKFAEEKESIPSMLAANILERLGSKYTEVREWFIMKKRVVANRIIRILAKTIGFAVPELPEDLDSEEERIRIKKEKRKSKRDAKKEAKMQQKEKKEETINNTSASTTSANSAAAPPPVVQPSPMQSRKTTTYVPKPPVDPSTFSNEEWDEHLNEEYKELKEDIVYSHTMPSYRSTERAVTEIQGMDPVLAIIVCSKDMNDLFIFSDKETFLDLIVDRLNFSVDYTYIYVITPTAAMYYGSDTCYHKLTVVFDNIRMLILRGQKFFDEKALKKIEGINMFRNIYIG